MVFLYFTSHFNGCAWNTTALSFSGAWAPEVVKNQCLLKLFKVRMSISEQFYKKRHLFWKLDWVGFHYIKLASFHLQNERHLVSQMHVFNLFLQLPDFIQRRLLQIQYWMNWHSRKVQIRAVYKRESWKSLYAQWSGLSEICDRIRHIHSVFKQSMTKKNKIISWSELWIKRHTTKWSSSKHSSNFKSELLSW